MGTAKHAWHNPIDVDEADAINKVHGSNSKAVCPEADSCGGQPYKKTWSSPAGASMPIIVS